MIPVPVSLIVALNDTWSQKVGGTQTVDMSMKLKDSTTHHNLMEINLDTYWGGGGGGGVG